MAYLYQKRGIWYLGWTDPQGRRRQQGLRTQDRTIADTALAQFSPVTGSPGRDNGGSPAG